jgi:hypothetical protein
VIHAQTQQQACPCEGGGHAEIERRCRLAGVSRAGYYRHWHASAPRQEETVVRDEIQRLSLEHHHYGYRRITVLLKRSGFAVNHKRVQRLRAEDNLLCVPKAGVPAGDDGQPASFRDLSEPGAPAYSHDSQPALGR